MSDSGDTWSAAPGAHPVVSGDARVTGWWAAGPWMWSAAVPDGGPAQPGGGPLLAQRVTACNGAAVIVTGRTVLSSTASRAVRRGLADGMAYSFAVTAVAAAGGGPAASGPVTPPTLSIMDSRAAVARTTDSPAWLGGAPGRAGDHSGCCGGRVGTGHRR